MKQYLDLLEHVMNNGKDIPDRTGTGTRSVTGQTMRFNLKDGFPIITTKRIAFNAVKAELLWFLSGSSDVKELQKLGCRIWDANADAPYWKPKARFEGDLGRIYGVQWRSWKAPDGREIDQVKNVIESIKKDPYGRRHIVTAWNPGELEQMALPPCHDLYQFFVRDNTLSLLMYQRSCDMFLGVPFNISSYALLLSMVAQTVNLEPYEFIHVLGDAHIYQNHFAQVKEQLSRTPFPLPQLVLNPLIKDVDVFTMDDIGLENYQHHEPIKAPMAV